MREGWFTPHVRKLCQNHLELMIRGNGKQQKSYRYIEDCVKARCLASKKPEKLAPGLIEVYNVGSNDTITVKEIADIVVSSLQLKDVKIVYTNGNGGRGWTGDVRKMLLDCSRFKGEGWRADLNSRDAVMRTVMGICRNLPTTR